MLEPLVLAGLICHLSSRLLACFIRPSVFNSFPLPYLCFHQCIQNPSRAPIGGLNLQPVTLISFRYHCRIFFQYSKHGAFQTGFLAQITVDCGAQGDRSLQ